MPLGLYPNETRDLLAGGVDPTTTPPNAPGFFAGSLDALGQGFEEGAAKALFALPPMHSQATFGMNLPESAYLNKPEPISPEDYELKLAADTTEALKSFRPDPHVTGAAGQTLFGLSSGLTRILAGAAIAGPVGGAVAVGGSEGVATARELTTNGVDADTANALGAGAALFSGAGALLPGGVGSTLLERVATGAYGQFGLGMLDRGLNHAVLDDAGYPQMAAAYRPLDGAAMLSDIVLGMGFGAVHHALVKPSDIDAAHAVKDADQVEQSAGGPAVDPRSRTAILDNATAAAERLIAGDDTPPRSADVTVVPDRAQEAARAANADGVDEAGREVAGAPVEAPEPAQTPQDIVADVLARTAVEPPKPPDAETAPVLDPATAEAVAQAEDALTRHEGLQVDNDEGVKVDATAALRAALDDIKNAQGDSELHRVAAACFGRG